MPPKLIKRPSNNPIKQEDRRRKRKIEETNLILNICHDPFECENRCW